MKSEMFLFHINKFSNKAFRKILSSLFLFICRIDAAVQSAYLGSKRSGKVNDSQSKSANARMKRLNFS